MTRADKLLEGFKLGSLGVGSKKPVITKGSGEIIRQGFNTVIKKDDAPFVYWKDPDGLTYFLLLEPNDGRYRHCYVQLYAGEKLEPYHSKHAGWTITSEDSEWGAGLDISSGYEEQVSEFDNLVSSIAADGIESLISKGIIAKMKPFGDSKVAFDQWLESKGVTSEE